MEALRSIPGNLADLGRGFTGMLGTPAQSEQAARSDEGGGGRKGVYAALRTKFGEGGHAGARAYAYLLFILIYFPCMAATATMLQEIGPWATLFDVLYLTMLGWIIATFFYQVVAGHQLLWICIPAALALLTVLGLRLAGRNTAVRL